ncbi:unnamed protein product [Caenorhabditis nigoni]
MSETPAPSIYETTFAKTEKTDAILVVQGKKLHVNKAILSYHSEYFDKLFNSDFKEKSMPEIEIKAVNFEHFAMLLSCVHGNTIKPYYYVAEKILELSDRFLLPSVKPFLEELLINSNRGRFEKLRIAEKCDLKDLLDNGIQQFTKDDRSDHLQENRDYRKFLKMSTTPALSIYETALAKTDKTDAILVVEGKKLHVNKALLSYHSDYFNALFNSDFKEKSMPEIEIEKVGFREFAILLSFVHGTRIKERYQNLEYILDLSDRFLLPSVKPYLEEILIKDNRCRVDKLRIAEKYQLDDLFKHAIQQFTKEDTLWKLERNSDYKELSADTKVLLLSHILRDFQSY